MDIYFQILELIENLFFYEWGGLELSYSLLTTDYYCGSSISNALIHCIAGGRSVCGYDFHTSALISIYQPDSYK